MNKTFTVKAYHTASPLYKQILCAYSCMYIIIICYINFSEEMVKSAKTFAH